MFENMIEYDKNGRISNFNVALQVRFWDAYCDVWRTGIGYNGEIICACCGGVLPISEIYEDAANCADLCPEEASVPIIPYEDWSDFSEEIG